MSRMFLPRDIYAYLTSKVLGQAGVLRLISVSIYKHIHGLKAGNVLFIGNSGTGKTTVMRAISQFYEDHDELAAFRTMVIINANTLAPEVEGEDRATRLFRRIEARVRALCGGDLTARQLKEAMENATVCVDEVDKISARVSGKANVEGITTQYALLTLLEGENILYRTEVVGEDGKRCMADIAVDTSKLLFICGGAFEELFDQVYTLLVNRKDERRLKETSEVDRQPDGTVKVRTVVRFKLKDYLRLSDMFAYGMMPQFVSRFSTIALFEELGREELKKIMLTADDSPLRASRDYFRHMGVTLRLTDKALDLIAEHAMKNTRIGARALREIYTGLIADYEFDPATSPKLAATEGGQVLTTDQEAVAAYLAG